MAYSYLLKIPPNQIYNMKLLYFLAVCKFGGALCIKRMSYTADKSQILTNVNFRFFLSLLDQDLCYGWL